VRVEFTYAFSSKEDGRGAVLRGPMPAMVDAEVAEVSRVVLAEFVKFYLQFGCRVKDGSSK
jgi:hypothetical protein